MGLSFDELSWPLPLTKILPATACGMFVIITRCVCVLTPVSGFCISIISASICKIWWGQDVSQEGTGGAPGPAQLWAAPQRGARCWAMGSNAMASPNLPLSLERSPPDRVSSHRLTVSLPPTEGTGTARVSR